MTDELRSALAESALRPTVSTPPVADILRAGRARRRRRRLAMTATAVCVAAAVAAVPLSRPGPQTAQPAAPAAGVYAPPVASVTTVIGKNTVGGRTWWILAVYYPTAPHACSGVPGFPTPTGAPTGTARTAGTPLTFPTGKTAATPVKPNSYYAITIGASENGKTVSQQFECVAGLHGQPTAWDGAGDYGLDGASPAGTRVFNGQPTAVVTSATLTMSNGATMTEPVAVLPGTGAHTYAFIIPGNLRERSVDEYDAHHHLVDHQNL